MTYFQPLRRKLGVVTLLMACVLLAGWVRSLSIMDTLKFSSFPNELLLASVDGFFGWQEFGEADARSLFSRVRWESGNARSIDSIVTPADDSNIWGWHGPGIVQFAGSSHIVVIPYWWIVLPLAALSAWLLRPDFPRRRNNQPPDDRCSAHN